MKPSPAPAERLKAILESPTYRLAYEDSELLNQDDLRPLRLQLELLKPERSLRADVGLFTIVDKAEEIVAALERFHAGRMPESASQ